MIGEHLRAEHAARHMPVLILADGNPPCREGMEMEMIEESLAKESHSHGNNIKMIANARPNRQA
jgi:hypothetical protein